MTTTVIDIPLAKILPSPFNHRKIFTGLTELAASIAEKGLISPVTVRPAPKGRSEPPYELVVGERRLRAVKLAGLDTIAAIVRELDDQAVLEVQLVENVQRSDVHPLEEADVYRALIEKYKHTAETIAAKTGKSKAYIYARLKLCDLAAAPRKAFLEDKLNPSVALYIARIADPKLQAQATSEVLGQGDYKDYQGSGVTAHHIREADDDNDDVDDDFDGDGKPDESVPLSVREAQVHIQRKYMLRLETAPFDTADATLVAKAGACTACPKRTGNQRELFADVRSADVCTDPACFDVKKSADFDRKAANAKKTGARVLTEKEAKGVFEQYGSKTALSYDSAYVDPAGNLPHDLMTPKRKTWKDLLGTATPATVVAKDGSGAARTLWDKHSALAAAKKSGAIKEAKAEAKARSSSSSSNNDWNRQQAKRQAEAKKRAQVARLAFAKLASSKVAVDGKLWRWLASAIVEVLDAEDIRNWMKRHDQDAKGSGHNHAKKVVDLMCKAKDEELPGLVVELVASFRAVGGVWASGAGYGKNFTSACAHFKVDLAKLKAEQAAADKSKSKGKKPAKAKK